ncbi:MAG TPA: glucosamine-6-phosphate deaminase, partial [Ferruginibacter sp.]|nr:glucosamine-6-phosphate deaminase [Ferruginibacter sp.]
MNTGLNDMHFMTKQKSIDLSDSFEKIPCTIFRDAISGSKHVAQVIAQLIRDKQQQGLPCVLGLATGSTPISLYTELVRLHKQEGLSFKNVVTFNLDEYYPLDKTASQSYYHFMHRLLFNHIDIDPSNIHIPDGNLPKEKVKKHCEVYEQQIEVSGGIDLQILGIGNNGHVGFNEPGSGMFSKTRLVNLENSTRMANAYEFANISQVPRMAITMGLNTILKAGKVILMAWGSGKATVVQKAVEGHVSEQVPASVLQQHADCIFVMDDPAAAELTRNKSPWLTGECEWTDAMIRRAVVNMALTLPKPILSLTTQDYNEFGLADLLVEKGDVYEINLQVYFMLRDTITGWPGG